eukprot:7952742-Alexandrium_andersonii.AAC.1
MASVSTCIGDPGGPTSALRSSDPSPSAVPRGGAGEDGALCGPPPPAEVSGAPAGGTVATRAAWDTARARGGARPCRPKASAASCVARCHAR